MDAAVVGLIVLATVGIGYSREYSAQTAAEALGKRVKTRTTVLRGGRSESVPVEEVVPGDVLMLSAGSIVPADAVILEAVDCHVSESVLTGESFPVSKHAGCSPVAAALAKRSNCSGDHHRLRAGDRVAEELFLPPLRLKHALPARYSWSQFAGISGAPGGTAARLAAARCPPVSLIRCSAIAW